MHTSIVEVSIAKLESSMMKILKSLRYLKMLVLQESKWERWDIFLMLYVDDILVIGNYVFFLILLSFH
jgi:hypothetical protein